MTASRPRQAALRGLRRFLVFGAVSTAGAAIDFTVGLSLMTAGLSPAAALACAMLLSATLVYLVHQRLTFADLSGPVPSWRRLGGFLASTVLIYAFRVVLFDLLQGAGVGVPVALAAALILSVILNYSVSRILIFARGSRP